MQNLSRLGICIDTSLEYAYDRLRSHRYNNAFVTGVRIGFHEVLVATTCLARLIWPKTSSQRDGDVERELPGQRLRHTRICYRLKPDWPPCSRMAAVEEFSAKRKCEIHGLH